MYKYKIVTTNLDMNPTLKNKLPLPESLMLSPHLKMFTIYPLILL